MAGGRNGARQRGYIISPPLTLARALIALDALHVEEFSREALVAAGGADFLLVFLDELLIQPAGGHGFVFDEDEDHVLPVGREEERSHPLRGIDVRHVLPAVRKVEAEIILRVFLDFVGEGGGRKRKKDAENEGGKRSESGKCHKPQAWRMQDRAVLSG